ncbi:MAG TPA: TIGR03620 family F420-dependent LLM class oxidoreductase [Acidimicrobiia bacterium]|nr:TIGR03620 family F420-dependent LLM class oxidoreductase [Acidimicrobiia bacterium]
MTFDRLGRVGVWSGALKRLPTPQAITLAAEYEDLGFRSLWLPESPGGKDVLTFAAVMLGATRDLAVATGIAIIWVRDPVAMMNASRTLADAFPKRFVLGLGVSHESTALMRGHAYRRPLSMMRSYLEGMDAAPFDGHPPDHPAPRVLAALGPKMTALAGEMADGIHPFLSTPEHVSAAREILGPDKFIGAEQAVVLTTDAESARTAARKNLSRFLAWPNYMNHLKRTGFDEEELANGGSDRLIDRLYAWGDEAKIRQGVRRHLAAGADHVCLQIVPVGNRGEAETVRALAPAVLDL